jgi:RNA polymerase sigma factor (sigma-70 family)
MSTFPHHVYAITEYQDFAQDVFVRLFANLSALKDAKAFPGYLREITLSVALSYGRKYYPEVEPINENTKIVTALDEQILTGILIRSYLEQLSAREQEILTLEFLEERSPREIAELLRITPGAVRMTKARALKSLRRMIVRDAKALNRGSKKH